LSDAGGTLATPYLVIEIKTPEQATAQVLEIVRAEGVERIVLGLPLNMDDSIGPAAKATLAWGANFATRSGKPVLYVDERLSSFEAEQTLTEQKKRGEKITRKAKKERLDAVAAAGFLQAFLDGKLPAIAP
jgi:putative Holliday junction resolvase